MLDAAHVQPDLGPARNHVQSGLLLTKEFHPLLDRGHVTVTPDPVVHVSERLAADRPNGRRYEDFDRRKLSFVPQDERSRPRGLALESHGDERFLG